MINALILVCATLGAVKWISEWLKSLPVDVDYPYSEYPNEEDEDDDF